MLVAARVVQGACRCLDILQVIMGEVLGVFSLLFDQLVSELLAVTLVFFIFAC